MSNFLLAVNQAELLAGSRVLRAVLSSDNPQVQREVTQALGDCSRDDAVKCAGSLHGAYLAANTPEQVEEKEL